MPNSSSSHPAGSRSAIDAQLAMCSERSESLNGVTASFPSTMKSFPLKRHSKNAPACLEDSQEACSFSHTRALPITIS